MVCPSEQQHVNEYTNRLVLEKSPYLLQHAYNPVDWYPWGVDAFDKAKRENKPIFLSIGYSTCHWCHVMAHESFEDPHVAQLMNDTFVSIKVDKEERPDIDGIYMSVCQMVTGSGGWPLTIIMTPEKKPFFAATYIPKQARYGRTGMMELIPHVRQLWETRREDVLHSAEEITNQLQHLMPAASGPELDDQVLTAAFRSLSDRFDEKHGGFGTAPKFPTPHNLTFLLRYWKRTDEAQALEMVEKTLRSMRQGGMYDHVGFGFHRYATDERWLVPHFEKMLYDQAMLTMAYVEAFQATGIDEYQQTAEEVLTYVLRDMTSADGGFYSAEDADSEGEEGKFYLWTVEELEQVLPTEEADFVMHMFNVEQEGNFREEATGEKTGGNIFHMTTSIDELASELGVQAESLQARWEAIRERLLAIRETRPRPHRDEKILTDWNGLMIAAMAKAGRAFGRSDYVVAACNASDFILSRMRDDQGRLYHRFGDGEVAIPGFVDDYAFFIWGLLEVYEATFKVNYLQAALELTDTMNDLFWDEDGDGFFFSADDAESLLVRRKEIYDGAIPSGNSVAMLNFLRLGRITTRTQYLEKAMEVGRAFAADIERVPVGYTQLLTALDFQLGPSFEIVIVGDIESDDTKGILKTLRGRFIPNTIVLQRPTRDETHDLSTYAEYTRYMTDIDGQATVYVCRNYSCQQPTTDVKEMLDMLEK